MSKKVSTADRILEAGRRLFNERGYAATSMGDIAAAVGISKGNLTYHFPTKQTLALRLRDNTRALARERRHTIQTDSVEDDYVEHLVSGMNLTWNNRFLFRDSHEFEDVKTGRSDELKADFEELHGLLQRIHAAGYFRRDADVNLELLARSIWIVSRYWMDYLRESEGVKTVEWADQERGIRHQFAVLLPCMTATARRRFEAALERAPRLASSG